MTDINVSEIAILKYLSSRGSSTTIGNITSHFLGSMSFEKKEQTIQKLLDKKLIAVQQNNISLTTPGGTEFIDTYDMYDHDEIYAGNLRFVILKFLYTLNDKISLDILPAIFKKHVPHQANGSDELQLIHYLEYNSEMKQYVKTAGNHKYELSAEGKVRFEFELKQRGVSKQISNVPSNNIGQKTSIYPVVFIIHGHDEVMKRDVQLFLSRVKLQDIVLHEQPDKNRTIIQKLIEEGEKASYVIALLSPDDIQHDGTARARQNVILEIGYFLGKLGGPFVRLLVKGDTTVPGDLQGILYDDYDANGAWKIKLAKEIKAAGLPVDLENIVKHF